MITFVLARKKMLIYNKKKEKFQSERLRDSRISQVRSQVIRPVSAFPY